MITSHWVIESSRGTSNWYNFYGTRSGNQKIGTGKKVDTALNGYTGELDLFKQVLEFDARATINYILHELVLTSNTGTLERRGILRLYSNPELRELYNTASDDRLDPSNRLFDDIIAVLSERGVHVTKILVENNNPTSNAYRHNPLTGNSEAIDKGTQRYHIY